MEPNQQVVFRRVPRRRLRGEQVACNRFVKARQRTINGLAGERIRETDIFLFRDRYFFFFRPGTSTIFHNVFARARARETVTPKDENRTSRRYILYDGYERSSGKWLGTRWIIYRQNRFGGTPPVKNVRLPDASEWPTNKHYSSV